MKVLVVGPKSVHVSTFLSALAKQGVIADLLSEESCGFENVKQEYVTPFRSKNPLKWMVSNNELKRILANQKPDVVHIHQANRHAYFVTRLCSRLGIKVVLSVWGSDVLLVPKRNAIYKFLVKRTIQRSSVVIGNSNNVIEALKEFTLPAQKVINLHYGVDLIEPKPKEKLIYSNRAHEPLYRIGQIIKYSASFFKIHPDWKLVVAGVGSETERIKQLVEEFEITDYVDFIGWQDQDQNRNWYAIASIYISIPESDGTSVSVLEAMSAECVMVLPDLPVSRELIADGVGGIIESTSDNPLLKAVEIDAAICGKENREFVASTASREKCTALHIKLYSELANES